jgi:hypothetical protein
VSDIEGKMAEWRKTLWGAGPCPVPSQENFTLTDAEREAVKMGISSCEQIGQYQHWADRINERAAATLRGLLERLNPPATDRP